MNLFNDLMTHNSLLLLSLPACSPSLHPHDLVGPGHVLAEGLGIHIAVSTVLALEWLFSRVVSFVAHLEGDSIEKFQFEIWLEKSHEFWLENPYTSVQKLVV